MKSEITRIEKPWGYELVFAKTRNYVGKIIHINKGCKLSLQYHEQKEETIYLQKGQMCFIYEETTGNLTEITLKPGEAHHIPVGKKHRMVAIEACDVFEVSTPQLGDIVRLEDCYGRTDP